MLLITKTLLGLVVLATLAGIDAVPGRLNGMCSRVFSGIERLIYNTYSILYTWRRLIFNAMINGG